MATRINRAIELAGPGPADLLLGRHTGHVLTYEQGKKDVHIWADYINVGLEHGALDLAGLAEYLHRHGRRRPDEPRAPHADGDRRGAGQRHRRRRTSASTPGSSARSSAAARTASCSARRRRPARCARSSSRAATRNGTIGTDPSFATPLERLRGADRGRPGMKDGRPLLGLGTRGRGSESTARPSGARRPTSTPRALRSVAAQPGRRAAAGGQAGEPGGDRQLRGDPGRAGPRLRRAGPGDLSHALGYKRMPDRDPYPPEMQEAREKVFAACKSERRRLPRRGMM